MEDQLVNAKTKIYAILGNPISHSMSPVIMNASFFRFHLDCVFLAMKCGKENADCVMKALRCIDLAGYVFTMPMKEVVRGYLDELKDEALLTGAVNCVQNKDGYLTGYNTDSMGFWTAVREKCEPERIIRKVFVMGMGGFAKAVVTQAALQGVSEIVVANRLWETEFVKGFEDFLKRLTKRCPQINIKLLDWDAESWEPELSDTDVVVNATSNGLNGKGDLKKHFPYKAAVKEAIFFDAIYSPLKTEYLLEAEKQGHRIVNGLDLLAHQGTCSFKIWTGITVSPDIMRRDALEFMERSQKEK